MQIKINAISGFLSIRQKQKPQYPLTSRHAWIKSPGWHFYDNYYYPRPRIFLLQPKKAVLFQTWLFQRMLHTRIVLFNSDSCWTMCGRIKRQTEHATWIYWGHVTGIKWTMTATSESCINDIKWHKLHNHTTSANTRPLREETNLSLSRHISYINTHKQWLKCLESASLPVCVEEIIYSFIGPPM